ncbi:MAG: hypothetical protein ACYCZD_11955 [Rhodanobacter sp.]
MSSTSKRHADHGFRTRSGLLLEWNRSEAATRPLASLGVSAARVPLPFAGVLRDGFLEALASGDAELDWSALALVAARRAHLDERESRGDSLRP